MQQTEWGEGISAAWGGTGVAPEGDPSPRLPRSMDENCFNRVASATNQCTLVLGDATVLEAVWVCEECLSDFRQEEWIEVREL